MICMARRCTQLSYLINISNISNAILVIPYLLNAVYDPRYRHPKIATMTQLTKRGTKQRGRGPVKITTTKIEVRRMSR
jgi:hypothetical protein